MNKQSEREPVTQRFAKTFKVMKVILWVALIVAAWYLTFPLMLQNVRRNAEGSAEAMERTQIFIMRWYPLIATLIGLWLVIVVHYAVVKGLKEVAKLREAMEEGLRDIKCQPRKEKAFAIESQGAEE